MAEMETKTLTVTLTDPQNADNVFQVYPLADMPLWVSERMNKDQVRNFRVQCLRLATAATTNNIDWDIMDDSIDYDAGIVIDRKRGPNYWQNITTLTDEQMGILRGLATMIGWPSASRRPWKAKRRFDAEVESAPGIDHWSANMRENHDWQSDTRSIRHW